MSAEIRIGTSGYHYKHWVGTFYPPKTQPLKMLEYYIQHFDTLELNNSFYRLPTIEAFESWRDATPKNFVFAVKPAVTLLTTRNSKTRRMPWRTFYLARSIWAGSLGRCSSSFRLIGR